MPLEYSRFTLFRKYESKIQRFLKFLIDNPFEKIFVMYNKCFYFLDEVYRADNIPEFFINKTNFVMKKEISHKAETLMYAI